MKELRMIKRSNFLTISLTNSNIFKLCDFPISNYKNISLNKISDALNKIKHPDIALLGLGDDGHYASIFQPKLLKMMKTII